MSKLKPIPGLGPGFYECEVPASPVPHNDFVAWWNSEPHRLKYDYDHPVYLAAWEAWDAARELNRP